MTRGLLKLLVSLGCGGSQIYMKSEFLQQIRDEYILITILALGKKIIQKKINNLREHKTIQSSLAKLKTTT